MLFRSQEVQWDGRDVVSVYITGERLGELRVEPGQFFRWRFLTRDLWWTALPYSLSSPVSRGGLRISVKVVGDHSRAIAMLRPGTRLIAEGPFGALTAAARRRRKVLLVAGGVGITPLRALFETLPAGPGDITLVYRARQVDDLVFRQELEDLAHDRGAGLRYVVGRRSEIRRDPLSVDALKANVPDLRNHEVYVCGPPGMTTGVTNALRSAGVPRGHIHTESFAW